MKTDNLSTREKPQAGDILVKRKENTVQITRHPNPVLTTLDAETAIKLAHELLFHADKILKAEGSIDA